MRVRTKAGNFYEFFTVGKYFIFGAGLASLFQVLLGQQTVLSLAESAFIAPGIMMIMAYILSPSHSLLMKDNSEQKQLFTIIGTAWS